MFTLQVAYRTTRITHVSGGTRSVWKMTDYSLSLRTSNIRPHLLLTDFTVSIHTALAKFQIVTFDTSPETNHPQSIAPFSIFL